MKIMLNKNYHSKQIVYPVLKEEEIIQYLKDHKLKNVMNSILTVITPMEEIVVKPDLKEDELILHILFSTKLEPNIVEDTTKTIKTITQDYNNITLKVNRINKGRLNIIRGFN